MQFKVCLIFWILCFMFHWESCCSRQDSSHTEASKIHSRCCSLRIHVGSFNLPSRLKALRTSWSSWSMFWTPLDDPPVWKCFGLFYCSFWLQESVQCCFYGLCSAPVHLKVPFLCLWCCSWSLKFCFSKSLMFVLFYWSIMACLFWVVCNFFLILLASAVLLIFAIYNTCNIFI